MLSLASSASPLLVKSVPPHTSAIVTAANLLQHKLRLPYLFTPRRPRGAGCAPYQTSEHAYPILQHPVLLSTYAGYDVPVVCLNSPAQHVVRPLVQREVPRRRSSLTSLLLPPDPPEGRGSVPSRSHGPRLPAHLRRVLHPIRTPAQPPSGPTAGCTHNRGRAR